MDIARPRLGRIGRGTAAIGIVVAVLVGAAVATPHLLSSRGASWAEQRFAAQYHGSLRVGSLDLAWFRPQRVGDLEIADPDGATVLRGAAELPSLADLLRGGFERPGRIDVTLEADLIRAADGITNLERALEPRAPADPKDDGAGVRELELHVRAPRVTWRDDSRPGPPVVLTDLALSVRRRDDVPDEVRAEARLGAAGSIELGADVAWPERSGGPPARVELRGEARDLAPADLAPLLPPGLDLADLGQPLALDLSGLLAADARTIDVQLTGPAANLDLDVEILAAPIALPGQEQPAASWDFTVTGGGGALPTAAVDRWTGARGLLSEVFGPALQIDVELGFRGLELTDALAPFEIALSSERAALSASGRLEAGRIRTGAGQGLALSFQLGPLFQRQIVDPLLPMLSATTRPVDGPPVRVALRDVDVGLSPGAQGRRARIELALGPADLNLAPELARALGTPLVLSIGDEVFDLSLDGDRVRYDALAPRAGGEPFPIQGDYDMATGALRLTAEVPAQLVADRLREDLGPAADLIGRAVAVGLEISGTARAPRVRLVPPELDAESVGAGVQEALRDLLRRRE